MPKSPVTKLPRLMAAVITVKVTSRRSSPLRCDARRALTNRSDESIEYSMVSRPACTAEKAFRYDSRSSSTSSCCVRKFGSCARGGESEAARARGERVRAAVSFERRDGERERERERESERTEGTGRGDA
jgi:hypothetical protein